MTTRRAELPQERRTNAPGGFKHVGSLIQLEQLATFVDRGRAAQEKVDRLSPAPAGARARRRPTTALEQLEALEDALHATLAAAAPITYQTELRRPLVRLLRRARRVLRDLEARKC